MRSPVEESEFVERVPYGHEHALAEPEDVAPGLETSGLRHSVFSGAPPGSHDKHLVPFGLGDLPTTHGGHSLE